MPKELARRQLSRWSWLMRFAENPIVQRFAEQKYRQLLDRSI